VTGPEVDQVLKDAASASPEVVNRLKQALNRK
jgi:hypothetical protein